MTAAIAYDESILFEMVEGHVEALPAGEEGALRDVLSLYFEIQGN